jgi:hypothetical protein
MTGKHSRGGNASNCSMNKPNQTASNQLHFTFNKSSLHRVIKVDGVWGGMTPKSDIQMAIYSERLPIPDTQVIEIDEAGQAKTIRQTGTTKGLIREVEATLTMPPQVARAIGEWLIERSNEFDALLDSIPDEKLQAAFTKYKDAKKDK